MLIAKMATAWDCNDGNNKAIANIVFLRYLKGIYRVKEEGSSMIKLYFCGIFYGILLYFLPR